MPNLTREQIQKALEVQRARKEHIERTLEESEGLGEQDLNFFRDTLKETEGRIAEAERRVQEIDDAAETERLRQEADETSDLLKVGREAERQGRLSSMPKAVRSKYLEAKRRDAEARLVGYARVLSENPADTT